MPSDAMALAARERLSLGAIVFAHALLSSTRAFACPDCASARLVRASVFDQQFWTSLLWVSSPLAVLAVIAALLHRIDRSSAPQLPSDTTQEGGQ